MFVHTEDAFSTTSFRTSESRSACRAEHLHPLGMFIDAKELTSNTIIDADICIIGAGPAGLTLASELDGCGAKVALLESGALEPDAATQALAAGDVVGALYWALDTSRLRYFGGSSNHWTGWCRPLDPDDFERRRFVGYSGWPLARAEIEPFYERAQQVCDLGAFDYDARSWAARTSAPLLDLDEARVKTAIWQFSAPTRFGRKYRAQLEHSSDVSVYLNGNVVELLAEPGGRRVRSVEVACLDGLRFRVHAQLVVLAAGGIENARLLLVSRSEHIGGMGNQHDLVGRFFIEHPHSAVGVLLCGAEMDAFRLYSGLIDIPGASPAAVRASLCLPPELRDRERLLNVSVGFEPMMRPPSYAASQADGTCELARQLQGVKLFNRLELTVRAEQAPTADSRVRLSSRKDALGSQLPALDWRHDPLTLRSIRRTVEIAAEALARARLGRVYSYIHADATPTLTGVWPELSGGHHHMGTTRMHEDARYGVVDRDCKLHGVENLYVAGSSAFPTAGYANPTLTITALALRLAGMLEERLS